MQEQMVEILALGPREGLVILLHATWPYLLSVLLIVAIGCIMAFRAKVATSALLNLPR